MRKLTAVSLAVLASIFLPGCATTEAPANAGIPPVSAPPQRVVAPASGQSPTVLIPAAIEYLCQLIGP